MKNLISLTSAFGLFGLLVLAVVMAFVGVWVGMLLWNGIMAGVFNTPELTFWQTFGLSVLVWMCGQTFRAGANKN